MMESREHSIRPSNVPSGLGGSFQLRSGQPSFVQRGLDGLGDVAHLARFIGSRRLKSKKRQCKKCGDGSNRSHDPWKIRGKKVSKGFGDGAAHSKRGTGAGPSSSSKSPNQTGLAQPLLKTIWSEEIFLCDPSRSMGLLDSVSSHRARILLLVETQFEGLRRKVWFCGCQG
jgi:hypothetical protein